MIVWYLEIFETDLRVKGVGMVCGGAYRVGRAATREWCKNEQPQTTKSRGAKYGGNNGWARAEVAGTRVDYFELR